MTQLFASLAANDAVVVAVLAIGGAGVGLWLAVAWWTFADLSRRVDPAFVGLLAPAWIIASTPVLLPFSLSAYLLVRPQETIAERRARRLLGALTPSLADAATCSACGTRIEDGWRRCPACSEWLAAACSHCGRWSRIDLGLCPFCATDWSASDAVASAPKVAPAPKAAPAGPRVARWAGHREARDEHRAGRAASVPGPRLARIGR
ncbi:MAG TPA: zinc ribbon domain-containing protein [Candidatus Binatus sp.]|nr:zinc ribbon domain-containing protein [Candidatus Binatus sp.]